MSVIDLSTFQPAVFQDQWNFNHFVNPHVPTCFACNSRMLMVRPLGVTSKSFVVPATTRLRDGKFVIVPGAWLLFPRLHLTTFDQLPDSWTLSQQWARKLLSLEPPFNISSNWGQLAGQTTEHAHDWLIDRTTWPETDLTAGNGLATIILRTAQHHIELPA